MSSMLVAGSSIVLLILVTKFHDRLRRVEGDLERFGRQQAARPTAPTTPVCSTRKENTTVVEPSQAVEQGPAQPVGDEPMAGTTQSNDDRSVPDGTAGRPPRPPFDRSPPRVARESGDWDRLWSMNLPAKLGALITLLGFSFLLKLAIDQGWFNFPIWARHLAVGVAGLAFVVTGWRLRDSHTHLARALLGSGFATIQLTVYSAVLVSNVLDPVPGFTVVVLASLATGALAGILHSRAFAFLAIVGGLAAPMLLPDPTGQLTAVLAYYAILSGPTLWLASRERWPSLNLIAFAGVFGSSLIWIFVAIWGSDFSPAKTEPMVWLLFLLYAAVPLITHLRRGVTGVRHLERILLYATPGATLSLLGIVLQDQVDLALRSLAVGLFYAALGIALYRAPRIDAEFKRHFVALACGFTALAVPLGFDGHAVVALWALGGTFQIIAGSLRRSLHLTVAGIGLQLMAGYVWWVHGTPVGDLPAVTNGNVVSAAWVGLAGLIGAWVLDRRGRADWAPGLAWVPFVWGSGWWLVSGLKELHRVLPAESFPAAFLLFTFGTAAAAWLVEHRRRWAKLNLIAPIGALVLLDGLILFMGNVEHPSAHTGWLAWPFAIAVLLRFVRRNEVDGRGGFPFGYGLVHSVFLVCVSWELYHQVSRVANVFWAWISIALFLVVSALFRLTPSLSKRWPAGPTRDAHLKWIPAATTIVAMAAVGLLQLSPGDPVYVTFVPLLNPVDLVSALFLVLLYRLTRKEDPELGITLTTLLGWGFSTLTVARTVHHWTGVRFDPESLFASMTMQTSLTVYWSLLGVIGMILGTRRGGRTLWKAAAGLMTVVLIKLFLVDLAGVNTAARIISFLGVGGLLLLLGYLAPQPPRIGSQPSELSGTT